MAPKQPTPVRILPEGVWGGVQDWCRDAITDLVWPLLIMEHDLRASDARSRFADPECWP